MFGGGIADKFGNEYEAVWTVRQAMDVLLGKARSLHIEGLHPAFEGFEFAVAHDDHLSWHQTKINAPNGNWTLPALEREGVLQAFRQRLEASERDQCIFVSQTPAKDLLDLTEKAQYAAGFEDFTSAIGSEATDKFASFQTRMKASAEEAYGWLRRVFVRVLPEAEIRSAVAALSGWLFQSSPETALAELKGYLLQRMNRSLTTEQLREEIPRATSLRLKEWNLDPTLRRRLSSETDAYLQTYTPFGAGGQVIPRQETEGVLSLLDQADGPRIVLIKGAAGSGKSGVVRGIIDGLRARQRLHLALRIDQHLDCGTPADLGRELFRRDESPAVILKGLAPEAPAVLIVDQLDAVSEISGRNGRTKEAVLRMVDEAVIFETVSVVLVCRSFDVETDPRLRTLQKEKTFASIEVTLLEWERDVVPVLEMAGLPIDRLDPAQRDLIRVPINLAIFLEVAGARDGRFASRHDLFDRLVEKKERALRARDPSPSWSLMEPLTTLADWMSDHQKLDAPTAILDRFAGATDLLSSDNLIARGRKSINFFHESFFDYIYARGFCAREDTICTLLESSEQHLFRRTQVRQILDALRQSDRGRYLRELQALWTAPSVRYHVRHAVAQWLGALADPWAEECRIVLAGVDPAQPLSPLVRIAIYGSVGWFDRLQEIDWFLGELASLDAGRKHFALWSLEQLAAARPEAVAVLLTNWWRVDRAERSEALLSWFSHNPNTASAPLVALCMELMLSRPATLFPEDHAWRSIMQIALAARGTGDSSAASILKAGFDAWYTAHPGKHPFEDLRHDSFESYFLSELQNKAPKALVQGSVAALVRAFDMIADRQRSGMYEHTFTYRASGNIHSGGDAFFAAFRDALKMVAAQDPEFSCSVLAQIDPSSHDAALHLHLEAISANGSALGRNLIRLLKLPNLLDAGWYSAKWLSFATAAKAALPHLRLDERTRIESRILSIRPELHEAVEIAKAYCDSPNEKWRNNYRSDAIRYLSINGKQQQGILSAIGPEVLTSLAQLRLAELQRKFGDVSQNSPASVTVREIQPPILPERAAHMTDLQWLKAMAEHNQEDRWTHGQNITVGGARGLARVLQARAKEQPERFASLVTQMPTTANPIYVDCLLHGLAEASNVDLSSLEPAICMVWERDRVRFGSGILRILNERPELCKDYQFWNIVIWYINNGEADESLDIEFANRETTSIDDLLFHGSRFHIRGVNGERGGALEALSAVLWEVPERRSTAWKIIEDRIRNEPLVSVRCCIPSVLLPLFNEDKDRCATLLEQLVSLSDTSATPEEGGTDASLAPLITHSATRLLPHVVAQVPDVGRRLLDRLLASQDRTHQLIASWHIIRCSYNHETYISLADQLERVSPEVRRLAADIASQAIFEDIFANRACSKLIAFFDDDDPDVRREASSALRIQITKNRPLFDRLISSFVASRAFEDDAFGFFMVLEEANFDVTELAITAARHILRFRGGGAARSSKATIATYKLPDILMRAYAGSDHNINLRRDILDIIDVFLESESVDVNAKIKYYEPRF